MAVFWEIGISLLLGIISGIFTGITPGIHVNLVSVLVLSFSPLLLMITSPLILGVYIVSLAITHTFLDSLPSIYLGAPDEGQALNALPGHRLLLRGEGHNAVLYTVVGALGSLLLGILLFPVFIIGMRIISPQIEGMVGYFLILVIVYLILKEKSEKKIKSLLSFLLAGILGLLVFSLPALKQPLFPLLSGLFGLSLLVVSLNENSAIPRQKLSSPFALSKKNTIKSVSAATGLGFVAAFLPGFGSSQAATIGTAVTGDIGEEGFLSMVSGINTANMLISIATAYALQKARNGAIVAIQQLIERIGWQEILVFTSTALIAGGIAAILTVYFSKIFAKLIVKVNYRILIKGIILFIVLLAFYFDGFIGLAILATATAIGLLASSWRIAKSHLMGCLILPVILYFIF